MNELKYLTGYPEPLLVQVRNLIAENRVNDVLWKRYPEPNTVRTDAALRDYTLLLKSASRHDNSSRISCRSLERRRFPASFR